MRDEVANVHDLLKIDSVLDAEQLAKVKHVFSGYISRRAFGIGATTNASDRRVRDTDAIAKGDNKILDGSIVGVVEVCCESFLRQIYCVQQSLAKCWRSDTYRISERDFIATHVKKCARNLANQDRIYFALVWAPHDT